MPSRILHISDLHVGSREESPIHRALAPLVASVDPELVIVSGDLTHRGRRDQHEGAASFLRDLGRPLLVIPGNHDIPSWASLGRFTRTFDEFERQWERTEPVYRSEHILAVGLNSVRPYRHQSGALGERQLRWVAEEMARAPEDALRVVVLHHHLLGAPWRSWKPPLSRRTRVLARLVDRTLGNWLELRPETRTRYRVIRRSALVTIVTVGILSALLVIPPVRAVAGTILASSAVIALVVGFAAQTTLSNFVAGVLIAFTQPLRLGDQVEIGQASGIVEEIGLTWTLIRAPDGARFFVPNTKLASDTIRNATFTGTPAAPRRGAQGA